MTKNKSRDEVENLRGKIRQLQKENKELHKQIGRLQKRSTQYHDLEERTQDEELEKVVTEVVETGKVKLMCPKCKTGKLTFSDIGLRKLTRCSECLYRKSEK